MAYEILPNINQMWISENFLVVRDELRTIWQGLDYHTKLDGSWISERLHPEVESFIDMACFAAKYVLSSSDAAKLIMSANDFETLGMTLDVEPESIVVNFKPDMYKRTKEWLTYLFEKSTPMSRLAASWANDLPKDCHLYCVSVGRATNKNYTHMDIYRGLLKSNKPPKTA